MISMKKDTVISRRNFLAAAGGALVSIGLPGTFVKLFASEQMAVASEIRQDGRPRIPPGQEAVKSLLDMGGNPGTATVENYTLHVNGEVETPLALSYKDLLALNQVQLTCDVHCVTGWTLLDSSWIGVHMSTIMLLAKPRKEANYVIFEASGGYTANIPMAEARKENVILARSFGDRNLSNVHGGPIRALVPDRYFYKSAKWLESIRFSAKDEPGFWESRGYSNSADPWKEERYQ